jgi:hypothetical protein
LLAASFADGYRVVVETIFDDDVQGEGFDVSESTLLMLLVSREIGR